MGWGSAGTPRWGGLGLGCQQHPRGGGVPSPHWHLLSTASAAPTGLSHAVNLARCPRGRDQVGLQGWKALERDSCEDWLLLWPSHRLLCGEHQEKCCFSGISGR